MEMQCPHGETVRMEADHDDSLVSRNTEALLAMFCLNFGHDDAELHPLVVAGDVGDGHVLLGGGTA
jgi:hypothetical protein